MMAGAAPLGVPEVSVEVGERIVFTTIVCAKYKKLFACDPTCVAHQILFLPSQKLRATLYQIAAGECLKPLTFFTEREKQLTFSLPPLEHLDNVKAKFFSD